MVGYGSLVLPMIRKLKVEFRDIASPWYADDGSSASKLDSIIKLFLRLCEIGSNFDYFPEEFKSILIVKK